MLLLGPLAILRALIVHADTTYDRACCRIAGHEWSWGLAEALGATGPVCRRCKRTRP